MCDMIDLNNWPYCRFEILETETAAFNNIKSRSRLDCTAYKSPDVDCRGIMHLKSKKGQIYLNITRPEYVLKKIAEKRKPYINLSGTVPNQKGGINFTGVYVWGVQNKNFGYGYPDAHETYSKKCNHKNPFYEFRNDLYLFILTDDHTMVEMIVLPGEKSNAELYYPLLIEGELDEAFTFLRHQSKPLFNYSAALPLY